MCFRDEFPGVDGNVVAGGGEEVVVVAVVATGSLLENKFLILLTNLKIVEMKQELLHQHQVLLQSSALNIF